MKKPILIITTVFLAIACLQAQANNYGSGYSGGHRNSNISLSINFGNNNAGSHRYQSHQQGFTSNSHFRNDIWNNGSRSNRQINRYNNRRFNNRRYNSSRQYNFDSGLFSTGLFGNFSVIPYQPSPRFTNRRLNHNDRHSSVIYRHNTRPNRYHSSSDHRTHRAGTSSRSSKGECFERTYDEQGNEIKIVLESWECDF